MAKPTMLVAMAVLVATTSMVGDDPVPPGGIVSFGGARILHRTTLEERRALSTDYVPSQQLRRHRASPSTVGAGPPSSSHAPGGAAR
jgi:hypothetical protein